MSDYERLRDALRERQDEPRVKRMWDRIDAARKAPEPRRTPRRVAWAAMGIAAAAAVAIVLFVSSAPAEPVALTREDATPLAGALAPGGEVRLSDGSHIELDDAARLDVLESSPRTVALALRRGRARFVVTPGGPRAWRVDCGGVTVEVVGTVFTVERDDTRVAVAVERGSVLVRGDDVPDHVQRLEAGDVLEVGPRVIAPSSDVPATEPAVPEVAPAPRPEPPPVDVVERRVPSAPETPRTIDEDPVGTLLAEGDAARRRGNHAEAARIYERVVVQHDDDQRAAFAAYSLARLRLDRLGDARAAARDFERALALGLPEQLAEGAQAGRAIALARAGDPTAPGALSEYLAAHPQGRYRDEVRRWLGEP